MKGVKGVAALVAIALLAGCWDRTELNDLSITAATSIDRESPNEWAVSYQVVIPSAISGAMGNMKGGATQSPVIVYSTRGATIREAVMQSVFESPRKLFFSHNRVVVVSTEAARGGLDSLIDVYLRNPDTRETVDVLISDGEASEAIKQLMQIQVIPGEGIYETLQTESRFLSALPATNMYELAMQLTGASRSAIIPEIRISGSPPVTRSEQMGSTSLPSKLRLGRLAVLREGKMAGWLSQDEALGVAFLRNKLDKTSLSVSCKPSDPKVASAVAIGKSRTKIVPVRQKNGYGFIAKIKVQGTLMESTCDIDMDNPTEIHQLEGQVKERIGEIVRSGYAATQRLQADVVGFADRIHRTNPKAWHQMQKDWPSLYAQTPLTVEVEFTLKRMGLSSKSFKSLYEQGGR